jgi:type I site-specific restriction-modification system R (restriction) subunit
MVQPNISVTLEKDDNPGLEDELVKVLMEEIRKEMDEEVMRRMYLSDGWTEIKFEYKNNQHAVDIIDWCVETFTKNQWHRLNGCFVFKNKKDAEWFLLRWL